MMAKYKISQVHSVIEPLQALPVGDSIRHGFMKCCTKSHSVQQCAKSLEVTPSCVLF
jgi:hypothetical protein